MRLHLKYLSNDARMLFGETVLMTGVVDIEVFFERLLL
jgi:hypothetical protein